MSTEERRPWLVLAGCFLMGVGINAYLIAPASLLPLLVAQFPIDKPGAGLSISAVYVGWILLQIPGGLLMDRYDNRLLVGVGLAVFLVVSVGGYLAASYPAFLLTRVAGGGAIVFLWTANANVITRSFPASRRALGTSLFITSAPVGFTIAQLLGPRIAAWGGWQSVLLVYPLVTLAGVPLFYLCLSEPVRNDSQIGLATFWRTLTRPAILAVSASSFCVYALIVFLNSWMPTYATETLGVDLAAAGAMTALVPAAGILARPGGGWLSDRLGGRHRLVVVAAFLLVIPVLGGVSVVGSTAGFVALLALAGFGSQLGTGVLYVYVGELAEDGTQGTALAVLTTLSISGAFLAPVAAGWLVDASSWPVVFAACGAVAVAGILAALAAPR